MSTTFEIGRWPARKRRVRSHCGEGPIATSSNRWPTYRGQPSKSSIAMSTVASGGGSGAVPGHGSERQVVEGRDLSREAVDALQVRPVAGRLDEEHVVDERQDVGERRSGLGRREQHDPGVVAAEADLVLGQDHPVGDEAAHLAAAQLEPVRQPRPRQRDGDGGAGAEVPGAADDRARLALADVDLRDLETVGVRVLLGLDDLPDLEEVEVAALVRDAARLDVLDLGGRDGEPRRELVERHVDRDVVAQPGDRDAHQNCLSTRRSPSQSARMSGMS